MSDAAKKIIWAAAGSIPSAILAVVLRKVFQVWGIFDPFSEWLGGWLKMHVSTAQVEWTIAGVIAIAGYAVMLRILWRHIQPIADASLSTNLPQSQRDIKVSAAETQQLERIGSPLQIEFGNDDRHERTQHFNDICIVRKTIHISIFNGSLGDIHDCNLKLVAATPRPNTGDHPSQFPIYLGGNFDLRSKQRKFIQIVSFAENPANATTLERDHIIISAASGGFFPGWTTIPIPSRDKPAILTLEAFAPGIVSQTAHFHVWVCQRRIHAQII